MFAYRDRTNLSAQTRLAYTDNPPEPGVRQKASLLGSSHTRKYHGNELCSYRYRSADPADSPRV